MTQPEDLLQDGHYAAKQLFCRDRFIAWSHRRRFAVMRSLVLPFAGKDKRLVDYGSGDGTFLAMVRRDFSALLGVDHSQESVDLCKGRFAEHPHIQFARPDVLESAEHSAAYDVVTCMEVLEHCVDSVRHQVLDDLFRLVKPGGVIAVSVPIETGPSLLVKEAMRTLAALRNLGDYKYKETYTPRELLKMTFAGPATAIERPVYHATATDPGQHGHKGFNWARIAAELSERARVEQRTFSPLSWSQGLLSSQAFLLCRPKA